MPAPATQLRSAPPFWRLPLDQLTASFRCTTAGLDDAEADARLREHGPNALRPARERHVLWEFLRRFRNPLVIVLLLASVISLALGDVASFAIVSVVVAMSVTLDFVQERRAGKAAAALARRVALRARCVRGGTEREIEVSRLVPGDVVELAAGDLVPADGRLLQAKDLFVNQALLTGESFPAEKDAAATPSTNALEDAANAVFMGTSVVSGTARVLVARTGPRTAIGEIADTLQSRAPPDAFELGTRQFGLLVMRLTMLLVLFVLLVNVFAHRPLLESFLFAVALAVGLTPELLPMIVSVTLAHGALRMSREEVIVKRLAAIHDLGSMEVLCTDKTGTLTEARIRLERHVDADGRDSARVLWLAALNSRFETGLRSPLDDAILAHDEVDLTGWQKIDEVPFDFERRRVSVLVEGQGKRLLVVKGAPEDVLRLSSSYERAGGADRAPLDAEASRRLLMQLDELGTEGFRVLATAWREVEPDRTHAGIADERQLVFAGFAAFLDPPKESAAEAIRALGALGVDVKVVTGDNELVTRHVCNRLALPVRGVLLGTEIQLLDDHALEARLEATTLFCRVAPAQKARIIRAIRRRGRVVGYLGDGINDAPSIQAADVGISVDEAVDVAKEAADIILLRHDLHVLASAVREGRRTFANILKYLMMATSSNFGNMASMAGATIFLPFLPMLPTQVLLNNLIYDFSELPIPLDGVEPREVARPQRWDLQLIQRFMVVAGSVSSVFDFLTFYLLLKVFHASEAEFQTGWFIESMATQILVIFVIRTRGRPWKSRPAPLLVAGSLGCLALAIAIPFSPLGRSFGFQAPPPLFLALVAVLVAVYLGAVEIAKQLFFKAIAARH